RRENDQAESRDRFRGARFSLNTWVWNTRSIFLWVATATSKNGADGSNASTKSKSRWDETRMLCRYRLSRPSSLTCCCEFSNTAAVSKAHCTSLLEDAGSNC